MARELDGNLMKFLIPTWIAVLRHITTRKPFIIWRCSAQHYNSVVVYLSTASSAFVANEAVEVILVDSLGAGLNPHSKHLIKCFLYVAITFYREICKNTTTGHRSAVTKLLEETRDKKKLRSKLKSLLLTPSCDNIQALISEMAKLNLRVVKVFDASAPPFDASAPPQKNWYDCGLFMWVSAYRLSTCLSTDKCTADGIRECLTNNVKIDDKVRPAINEAKIMRTRISWFFLLLQQWIRTYHQLGKDFKERVADLRSKGITPPTREKDIPYLCVKICGNRSEFLLRKYNATTNQWKIENDKGESQMIPMTYAQGEFKSGNKKIVFSNPVVPDSMHKYNSIQIVNDDLTRNKDVAPTPVHVACMYPHGDEHAWIRSELISYQSFSMDDDGTKQGEACGHKYKYDLTGLAIGQEMLDSVMGFVNSAACDKVSRKRKRVDLTF